MEHSSPALPQALRQLSRDAFGQTYRLEVMLAVAESPDGLICLTDLAQELRISASNVQLALQSLVKTDLVARLPRGDSRRRHYVRNPSAAWDWARQMKDLAAQRSTAQRTEPAVED